MLKNIKNIRIHQQKFKPYLLQYRWRFFNMSEKNKQADFQIVTSKKSKFKGNKKLNNLKNTETSEIDSELNTDEVLR